MRRTAVSEDDRTTMQRLLAILAAIGRHEKGATLARIASTTGLPKSTVHRTVGKLVDHQLVVRTPHGYRLGMLLLELGRQVPAERDLRVRALPFMLDLYAATQRAVMLATLHCGKVLYVEALTGHNSRIPPLTGYRQPPHTTALGKVLVSQAEGSMERLLRSPLRPRTRYSITVPSVLATELDRARSDGVAYDREETVVGLSCTAAPIVGPGGQTIAAIGLATPRESELEKLSTAARTAAAGIARSIDEAAPLPFEHELGLSPDITAQLTSIAAQA